MKRIALIAALLLLSGCANLKFAWSASYQTDNLVADLEAARQVQLDRAAADRASAQTTMMLAK